MNDYRIKYLTNDNREGKKDTFKTTSNGLKSYQEAVGDAIFKFVSPVGRKASDIKKLEIINHGKHYDIAIDYEIKPKTITEFINVCADTIEEALKVFTKYNTSATVQKIELIEDEEDEI